MKYIFENLKVKFVLFFTLIFVSVFIILPAPSGPLHTGTVAEAHILEPYISISASDETINNEAKYNEIQDSTEEDQTPEESSRTENSETPLPAARQYNNPPKTNPYTENYKAAKTALLSAKQLFTQAESIENAAQKKEEYKKAMAALQNLCNESPEIKKQFQAEYGDLPMTLGKTLEEKYGTLKSHTKGIEAVQAHIGGNMLTLNIFVNFKGVYGNKIAGHSYAGLAKQGFLLWQGEYAGSRYDFEKDMFFTVKMNIHDIYNGKGAREGQNYFNFNCLSSKGRGYTNYGIGYYTRSFLGTLNGRFIPGAHGDHTYGEIFMYDGLSSRYNSNQYIKVSAHELGHVLGIGDQYGNGLKHTSEVPNAGPGKKYIEGDIMGGHGYVTPNNIEMLLEAYITDSYQAYVNKGVEKKSAVIRSY